MRLQQHTSRKYKDRVYTKHCVVLPASALRELKWERLTSVTPSVAGDKLLLTPGQSSVLQRQTTRLYRGKQYVKTCLVIPRACLEKLGWRKGDELEWAIDGEGLTLQRGGARV